MSKRIDLLVDWLSYDGTQISNDPADATRAKVRVQEDAATEVTRLQSQIPNSTVDLEIVLPDADTTYLLIFTDQEISVKLNNSATAITLKPKTATKKAPTLQLRGSISKLLVSNASGAIANVDVIAAKA